MEKQKKYWITKVPSTCEKAKKYKRDAKAGTSQREQYGGTVHLFIGGTPKINKKNSENNMNNWVQLFC